MANIATSIIDKPLQKKGMPILSLLLSLFGMLFLNWDFQNVIILFVAEIFLMLLFALIKMFFALNELPFSKTLTERLVYLALGLGIGGLFVTFSVMFISKAMQFNSIFEQMKVELYQIVILTIGYLSNLIFHYYRNQKYKEAVPMHQMAPFIHVLVILAVLQGFTGHLLPSYSNLNQAVWGIVALILVKFFVDLMFAFFRN